MTAARLIALAADWQPQSTGGVIGRAVVDDGLIGIVVPYLIPLVLLLVALAEADVMCALRQVWSPCRQAAAPPPRSLSDLSPTSS